MKTKKDLNEQFSFCGRKECAKRYKDILEDKVTDGDLMSIWLECSTCMDMERQERIENGTLDKLSKLKQNLISLLEDKILKN